MREALRSTPLKLAGAVVAALFVLTPAVFLGPTEYSAYAAGVQAVGVVVALGFAAVTIHSDREDRRVDRVLELHHYLVEGELSDARYRLAMHLRAKGTAGKEGKVLRTTRDMLRDDAQLNRYDDPVSASSPFRDANRIMRFFERANCARVAHTVDEQLLHELIGRHAVWFAEAFRDEPPGAPADGLRELAAWTNTHLTHYKQFAANWGLNRARDFD